KIVVADALQDQKHRGRIAGIGDEVRALRRDGISLPGRQSHLFLRTLKKDANGSGHDIERRVVSRKYSKNRNVLLWESRWSPVAGNALATSLARFSSP